MVPLPVASPQAAAPQAVAPPAGVPQVAMQQMIAPPLSAPVPTIAAPEAPLASSPFEGSTIGQTPPASAPPSSAAGESFELEGAKIIARVGNEVILAGDILGPINELLASKANQIPPSEMEMVRQTLLRRNLEQVIQTKLIMIEARRKVGDDGMKQIDGKLFELFEERQVPKAMAKMNCSTRHELDEKLHAVGNSIDRERRAFAERNIARDFVQQQVKANDEISHEELVAEYLDHASSYDYPARVRWEQIMVRVASFRSKADAYAAIAAAGNRVLAGEPFADVARAVSQGSTAKDGGAQPWTTRGSLASTAVDQALFSLPVGQLSPILEDDRSFHIIRVVERKEAGRTQFSEVQNEIKKTIRQQRMETQINDYVAKLQKGTKIWTIFDGPDSGSTIAGATLYTPPSATGLPATPQQMASPPADGSMAGPRYR
ncbi:MAG TPA: peptidyl-prolyl cis-trans isomerase [Pirellulales bacterium]|nr:peptidyl-prolyl cis-trans isomerase [Pirellulales bacterium]